MYNSSNGKINNGGFADVLVRHDKSGLIIWSNSMERYVVPKTEDAKKYLNKIMQSENLDLDKVDIPLPLKEEFIKIGFQGKIREVFFNSEKLLGAPLEYYFDYTNLCNLSCDGCYNKLHLGGKIMPIDTVNKIISEMYDWGVMRLHLAGGEPTINPKGLENYLSTAKKYGIVTSMATNGMLLNDEICDIIVNNDIFSVSISIDGATEETNNQRRGGGSLNKAIEGIRNLARHRKEKNIKMEIDIKPTYLPGIDLQELEDLVLLSIDLSIDKIKFANPERSLNHPQGHYGRYKDEYYNIGIFINTLKEKYGDKISITNITNPLLGCLPIGIEGLKGCIGGQELITINPDGRITPCLMDDYYLGNIYEWGTMENFWNNSPLLREYIEKIDYDACGDCVAYKHCRGGCQVRKIVESGEIKGRDPLCPKEYIKGFEKSNIRELKQNEIMDNFKIINVFHSL